MKTQHSHTFFKKIIVPSSQSCCGQGNDSPLQYSCLGNPMGRLQPMGHRVRHDLATAPQHRIAVKINELTDLRP